MGKSTDQSQQFIRDGIYAGTVAAIFSGIPSVTACILRQPTLHAAQEDALFSLAAVGNVLVGDDSFHQNIYYLVGMSIHLFLSYFFAVTISYLTRNKQATFSAHLPSALITVLYAHIAHLIILPQLWPTPMLAELLSQTGHWPHIGDHLMFGVTVAFVLAKTKTAMVRMPQ